MANSIFLGPWYSGTAADTPRAIEEKLNTDFGAFFAANPSIAGQRQILRMTVSSENGVADSVMTTQTKINQMLAALAAQTGATINPIQLDPTRVRHNGISASVANQLTVALGTLGALPALAALGLTPLTVTRSVAYTGTITGATVGSTLTASGLPTGLVINSGARTITGTTVVTAATYPIVITETLVGSMGNGRTSNFSLVVS